MKTRAISFPKKASLFNDNALGKEWSLRNMCSASRPHLRQSCEREPAEHRLPLATNNRESTEEGGLMSYGVKASGLFSNLAVYVDRILKGASPSDLPIQRPTRFELVINAKTAKALGLTMPPTLLATADEIIE
jgi:ABC-type uncharacterized transport system substrate-binding protein